MYQIKITTKKRDKMSEHAEKALKHMGKLMQCIEELGEDDDDERTPQMGERRRRLSNGRYA